MSKFDWKSYNDERLQSALIMEMHNRTSQHNWIEPGIYPNVRDILALFILHSQNAESEPTHVLDFGSNPATWANLSNKIDVGKIHLHLLDPFGGQYSWKSPFFHECELLTSLSDLGDLAQSGLDCAVLGSVAQYDQDFLRLTFPRILALSPKNILISHTPFSKGEGFSSLQTNTQGLSQYLHSYEELREAMVECGYTLRFKSVMDPKFAAVETRYHSQVLFMNAIFTR